MKIIGVLGILAAFLTGQAAQAQDITGVYDMGLLTNTLSMDAVTQSERTRAMRGGAPDPLATTSRRPAAAALTYAFNGRAVPQRDIRLTYTATPALKREALDGYITRIARQNPEAARQTAAQFAQHDAGKIYRGISAPFGLRDNDTADILTGYTVLGWLIATGAPDPSPSAVRAARRQIAAGLAANATLSSPATRAQLGEELKLLFVTLHAGWQSARREGNLRQYGDGVARMFANQSGRDLRAVRLTERGFSRE